LKVIRWVIALIFLLLCSACQPILTSATAPPDYRLLFKDDFSNPPGNWTPGAQAEVGVAGYADGVYRITVSAANRDQWATPGLNLNDVRIEADAIKVGGDRNNRFGLICRVTRPGAFYIFIISSDGYYGIGKIKGSQYQLLGNQSLLPSDKIPRGSVYLHLRADCVQDRLALYVNGEKIAEASDAEFQTGDVGIIAGAYNTAGTDIFFDNFTVAKP
jgi:hypothetical protein